MEPVMHAIDRNLIQDPNMTASELTYFRDLAVWYMKEGFDFNEAITRAREEFEGEKGG